MPHVLYFISSHGYGHAARATAVIAELARRLPEVRDECPALGVIADALAATVSRADHHVQTEPVCVPAPGAQLVAPVSRAPRTSPLAVRRALGVPAEAPMVVVTMGGVGWREDAR